MFVVQLAYLAFVSIALPDSMLGVAWPSMRLSFGQPLSAAGLVPPVGVAASVVSTIAAPYLAARWGVGRLLAAGTALSAAALAGSALTPTWWGFLVTVTLGALASGAIDATLNAFAARRFGPQQINLLHACYGVGAVVSPLLVTVALATGAGWRAAFGVVAGLMFVIGVVFTVARHGWDDGMPAAASPAATREGRVWSLPATLGLVTVVLQTGLESSVAIWAYSYLTLERGVDPAVAGALASGYWLTLVVGRLGFGRLAERLGAWPVLGIASAVLLAAAVLINSPHPVAAMTAVVLFGLGCAPVYPLLILTTAQRTSPAVADRVIGLQAAASSVGAAILPGLLGLALDHDARWFALGLALLSLLIAGLLRLIGRRDGTAPQVPEGQ